MNLVQALQFLHDNPPQTLPIDENDLDSALGICSNLRTLHEQNTGEFPPDFYAYGFVGMNAWSWPLHSGDPGYPIPGSYEMHRLPRHYRSTHMWTGPQLAYRRSLLQHLIKKAW